MTFSILLHDYFKDILTFDGPLLSVLQAIIGTCFALNMTKYISNRCKISYQKKLNQGSVIIWALVSSVILVGMGSIGLHLKMPPFIYYPIPVIIALLLPKYLFNLSWKEEGLYVVLGTLTGIFTHILFSLFIGYNNYMPFFKIEAIR